MELIKELTLCSQNLHGNSEFSIHIHQKRALTFKVLISDERAQNYLRYTQFESYDGIPKIGNRHPFFM